MPHLKHPENGPKLIGIDFDLSTLGENKIDLLDMKLDGFIKNLKVLVSKKKITSKQDSEGKEILALLKKKDTNEALLVEILPSMLTCNRFVTVGNGYNAVKIKLSFVETRLSFVIRVNAAGD
ncbi:uncharacterized protein LOC127749091 isoform X2 [Frankliniella occidentalis]|uniref:Uncharacterized protein LOC127749091 isoform X2 n=1 Tax=Frankliniella occidentalis TaxID=133901 RepID=A0A9C6U270_FRAOC|nr:uncharacterized protein LOC127749091 isoform X2 [Frankliniella occidentalis]